jgi:hypothetical protein
MRSSPTHFAAPRQATRHNSAAFRFHDDDGVLQVLDTDSTHQGPGRDGSEDPIHLRDRPCRWSSCVCHECGLKGSSPRDAPTRCEGAGVGDWTLSDEEFPRAVTRHDWLALAALALQAAYLQSRVLECKLGQGCIEFAHSGACLERGRVKASVAR